MNKTASNNPGRFRRFGAALLATFLLASAATNALAALNAYESFNYTTIGQGTLAPSGTASQTNSGGYSGAWTFGNAASASLVSGGLAYPGLLTTNKALSINAVAGSYIQDNLAATLSTGTYYISYLFVPGTSVNGGNNGAGFQDDGMQITPGGAGLFMGIESYGATAGKFTVMKVTGGYNDNSGITLYQSAAEDITYGTTNLIVLKLVSTSANNWNGTIWINPTAGTSSEPAASGTFSGIACGGAIQQLALLNRTAGGNTLTFDEIRVGTTWADAVSYITVPPSVPNSLTVTSTGNNSVGLSWAAPGSGDVPVSYYVKRSTTSGSGYVKIATNAYPTATYTDSVAGGQTYYYVVSAVNAGGEGPNSSEVSATPTLAAPAAPTGVTAAASDSQVTLSWNSSVAATGYNVKRSTTSGAEVTIASTAGNNYADTSAVNGTTYYYKISATNSVGEGADSSEVTATPVAYVPVYEPFNYASLPNGTAVTGTGETGVWTNGSTPAMVAGMTYTANGTLPTANNALSSIGSRQSVTFQNSLFSGTKYVSFLINQIGNNGANFCGVYFPNGGTGLFLGYGFAPGGSSGQLGLGTINTVGTTALNAASTLQSSYVGTYGSNYLVVLKIDFNTSGNNDTVTVYINPTANSATPNVAATYTVSSFDVGTITGIGVNMVGGGQAIKVDEIRTGATYGSVVGYNPPATPTGLTATPFVNAVGLSWGVASGASGYQVLRGTSSGVYSVTNSASSNTNYDSTAVGGTTYFYAVQSTNTSGVSALSAEVSVTPSIALPNTPAGLTATGTNGAVNLSWSAALGAAGYYVKRSTTSGAETFLVDVGTTSYVDTSVVNGTTYFYKVSSTNSAGESANSSEVSATPNDPPAAPTSLTATAGTNQVSLTWTASAGATSYNVKRATTSGAEVTIATSGSASYTDTTAVKFTQYFYTVSAVSAYGESPDSSEVTATPAGTYGPTVGEPFAYALGTLANGTPSTGSGFTGNWNVSGAPGIVAGLTYPGLAATANSYLHGAAGAQTTVNFASPLSSGTKYVSFLIKGGGDPGANACGIFLKGNNASSLFVGFESPVSASLTGFGLGSVNSTALGGAAVMGATTPINNTNVHLAVVQIEFNTSGANDTVSLWIDPPAGVITPGVAANAVVTSFDVGVISALGINISGAFAIGLDEFRVGEVYGDVVDYSTTPAGSPVIAASVAGNQLTLTWPGGNLGWFLQTQTNDLSAGLSGNWVDISGSDTTTNAVINIEAANPSVFFRLRSP